MNMFKMPLSMLYTRPKQTSHVEKKICKALNQTANLSCQQTSQRLFSAPWFTMDGNEQRGKNEAYKPGAFRALFTKDKRLDWHCSYPLPK